MGRQLLPSPSEESLFGIIGLRQEHLGVELGTTETLGVELGGAVGALITEGVEASLEQELEVLPEDTSGVHEASGDLVLDETLVGFAREVFVCRSIDDVVAIEVVLARRDGVGCDERRGDGANDGRVTRTNSAVEVGREGVVTEDIANVVSSNIAGHTVAEVGEDEAGFGEGSDLTIDVELKVLVAGLFLHESVVLELFEELEGGNSVLAFGSIFTVLAEVAHEHVPSVILELDRVADAMILATDRHVTLETTVVGETTADRTIDTAGVGRDTFVGIANRELAGVDVALSKHTETGDETGEMELHVEDLLNGVVNIFEVRDAGVVDVTVVGKDVQGGAGAALISGTRRNVWVVLIGEVPEVVQAGWSGSESKLASSLCVIANC